MKNQQKINFHITEMTPAGAKEISRWQYKPPYEIYSMDGSTNLVNSLMSEDYYLVTTGDVLFGYFCLGEEGRVPGGYKAGIYDDNMYIDLGLGIHPNSTGKGYGKLFLATILNWLYEERNTSHIRLVVALLNERAIQLYNNAGFIENDVFISRVSDVDIPFSAMTLFIPNSAFFHHILKGN